jgi:hypothetical protein
VKVPTFVFGSPWADRRHILALGGVVQNEHRQSRAVPGFGVFEHLPIAGRIAKRRDGPSTNFQVDALGLARIVVVKQELWFFAEDRLAILS